MAFRCQFPAHESLWSITYGSRGKHVNFWAARLFSRQFPPYLEPWLTHKWHLNFSYAEDMPKITDIDKQFNP